MILNLEIVRVDSDYYDRFLKIKDGELSLLDYINYITAENYQIIRNQDVVILNY